MCIRVYDGGTPYRRRRFISNGNFIYVNKHKITLTRTPTHTHTEHGVWTLFIWIVNALELKRECWNCGTTHIFFFITVARIYYMCLVYIEFGYAQLSGFIQRLLKVKTLLAHIMLMNAKKMQIQLQYTSYRYKHINWLSSCRRLCMCVFRALFIQVPFYCPRSGS